MLVDAQSTSMGGHGPTSVGHSSRVRACGGEILRVILAAPLIVVVVGARFAYHCGVPLRQPPGAAFPFLRKRARVLPESFKETP